MKSVQIKSFFWSVFSRIWTEYGEILRISPYSVQMQENTEWKKLRIWTLFTQCIAWLDHHNFRFSSVKTPKSFLQFWQLSAESPATLTRGLYTRFLFEFKIDNALNL